MAEKSIIVNSNFCIGGNQTLWVSQDSPRKLLKAQGNLPPAMGGAGFTTELIGTE